MTDTHTTMLPLSRIRLDGGTQPRAMLDEATIAAYLRDIENGDTFPPVEVYHDGNDHWLVDGFHRVEVTRRLKRQQIEANVVQGNLQDAQWRSYAVNQRHGLRRTNDDKRRAVEAALKHEYAGRYSNVQIAQHCGVDEGTIRKYREKLSSEIPKIANTSERTVTRNGTTYTQNTANIGKRTNTEPPALERDTRAPELQPAPTPMHSPAPRPEPQVVSTAPAPYTTQEPAPQPPNGNGVSMPGQEPAPQPSNGNGSMPGQEPAPQPPNGNGVSMPKPAPAPEPPTPSREPEQETLDTATPFPHTINGVTIHQSNCCLVLAEMAPESVDLIITSPPYNVGVDYDDYNDNLSPEEYEALMHGWLQAALRVLKRDGRMCLNVPLDTHNAPTLGFRFFEHCQSAGFKLKTTIIWNEQNINKGTAWGSWKSASAPHVIAPVEFVFVLYKEQWEKTSAGVSTITADEFKTWAGAGGVWTFPGERRNGHPAAFPPELPRRCIKLFSYADDLILDPFAGSGSTGVAALEMGRQCILIEQSATYCKEIVWRLQ